MYAEDTFFHLSVAGQFGLAILSVVLAAFTAWLFSKISTRFSLSVKVLLALVFLWLFIWLSPQVYYFYYLLLFEGLPVQWVIQTPPTLSELFLTITFQGKATLSNHSKGALYWLMIVIALLQSSIKGHPRTLGK